jgi:hypothetical protein
MAVEDEDPNLSLESSSMPIIDLISKDSPLVQCTIELHALEKILDAGNWPLEPADLTNTLDNLKRIEAALDANQR